MIPQLVRKIIKKTIPIKVREGIESIMLYITICKVQSNHKKALKRVKNKDKIKVAFFLIHDACWKYEGVYQLMQNDKRFDPIVVVCPYIVYGEETMLREMNQAYENFKNRGYNVIKTLNETTYTWLDVKKEIKPDIVCFTNQWNLTRPEYYIKNFLDTLTCYVPYAFKNSYLYESHFNGSMQIFVWKFFLETEIHKRLSEKYSQNNSINTVVSGYPGLDKLLDKNYQPRDVWKIKDPSIKRIIWAPHHTIPGMGATLDYSTFFRFADFMLEMADKYKDKIQIAFKPHPILRAKLSKTEVWGKEKTNAYYQKWMNLQNGQLYEGEYVDLFLTSNGMIHDCGSFLIEYLCTNNPVMYLLNDDSVPERLNEVGKMALSLLYQGKNNDDIDRFINDVIIDDNDQMLNERLHFFNTIIRPPKDKTASENIFNYLKDSLFE